MQGSCQTCGRSLTETQSKFCSSDCFNRTMYKNGTPPDQPNMTNNQVKAAIKKYAKGE